MQSMNADVLKFLAKRFRFVAPFLLIPVGYGIYSSWERGELVEGILAAAGTMAFCAGLLFFIARQLKSP